MKNKVLITGSSGDISLSLISLLLEKDIEVIGIDKVEPVHIPKGVIFYKGDLNDMSEVEDLSREIGLNYSASITGVVHLAGIYPSVPYTHYTSEMWDQVHNVNVKAIFMMIKNLMLFELEKLQSIVLVSSAAAKVGSRDPAYASSKAALNGLAKSLSLTLKNREVRVNTILPGIIDTLMSQIQSQERRQHHVSKTLAQTIGRPEEVASVIQFLLSENASYVWGGSIDVNGGMTF